MEQFLWQPGDGPDAAALSRLRSAFLRPAQPMGEAWFMSEERRMFTELNGDLAQLNVCQLQEPLNEIASGTSSFGPFKEWHEWFHYLLGHLIPRCHEAYVSSLLESLITGFIALYPNGIHRPPYPQFQEDVPLTLGRCMMDRECWNGEEIVMGTLLHRSNRNPNQVWCWWNASGDFSSSLYFCLKYLPADLIHGWFSSVLAIQSPHWRAQVIAWLVGSYDMLHGTVKWPSEWQLEARPWVRWEWSHCLNPELAATDESGAAAVDSLLPDASRRIVLAATRDYFTPAAYAGWLRSISSVSYLKEELAEIPDTFERLYLRKQDVALRP